MELNIYKKESRYLAGLDTYASNNFITGKIWIKIYSADLPAHLRMHLKAFITIMGRTSHAANLETTQTNLSGRVTSPHMNLNNPQNIFNPSYPFLFGSIFSFPPPILSLLRFISYGRLRLP
jgi:hypothetical protein